MTAAGSCEDLEPRADVKAKKAFEATGLVLAKGQFVNLLWQCLPDTIDPRGAKTGIR